MAILDRLFDYRTSPLTGRQRRALAFDAATWQSHLGYESASGLEITPENALSSTAVMACVRVIAESVASLPFVLYERTPDGKQRALRHPLYALLHDQPNDDMTSFEFRETVMGHVLLWGNAYAEIEYTNAGRVRALWPLRPDRMTVARQNDRLVYFYQVTADSAPIPLPAERIMHIRGLSSDGVVGISPIHEMREAVGLAQAAEQFGGRFFGNDARPGVILSHPGTLTDSAYQRLKDSWDATHSGLDRSHRTALLEEGVTISTVGIPPEDAQFLETRKFQVAEIARAFRVPLHMVGDLERATNNNIEHQGIEFVVYTLRPWLVRIEQAVRRDLIQPAERARFYAEVLVDGLLRGDIKSRYEAYAVARQNGWLNADDIRALENMNALPNGQGAHYLVPLNMVPADQLTAQLPPEGERGAPPPASTLRPLPAADSAEPRSLPTGKGNTVGSAESALSLTPERRAAATARRTLQQAQLPLFRDIAARILRREVQDILSQARKQLQRRDIPAFSDWLARFYDEHIDYIKRQYEPLALSYVALVAAAAAAEISADAPDLAKWARAYAGNYAMRHISRYQARVRAILDEHPDDPLPILEEQLADWPDARADNIALEESVRLSNAAALATYVAYGITRKQWLSFGDNCPYCTNLNGRVIGIDQWFIPAGVDFQPGGATVVLRPSRNIGHAPAHDGCDCMIISA